MPPAAGQSRESRHKWEYSHGRFERGLFVAGSNFPDGTCQILSSLAESLAYFSQPPPPPPPPLPLSYDQKSTLFLPSFLRLIFLFISFLFSFVLLLRPSLILRTFGLTQLARSISSSFLMASFRFWTCVLYS